MTRLVPLVGHLLDQWGQQKGHRSLRQNNINVSHKVDHLWKKRSWPHLPRPATLQWPQHCECGIQTARCGEESQQMYWKGTFSCQLRFSLLEGYMINISQRRKGTHFQIFAAGFIFCMPSEVDPSGKKNESRHYIQPRPTRTNKLVKFPWGNKTIFIKAHSLNPNFHMHHQVRFREYHRHFCPVFSYKFHIDNVEGINHSRRLTSQMQFEHYPTDQHQLRKCSRNFRWTIYEYSWLVNLTPPERTPSEIRV